jgi:hypothetical protein
LRLLHHILACGTLAILPLSLIVAQTAATTTTPAAKKKAAPASVKGKSTPSTATRKRTTSTKGRSASASSAATRPGYRARQVQPTPDRYKEIQQALATKGYLKSEPTGSWNQESVDALKRFQQDQNINASGKIDSLSLIALGLGPKRADNATPPPPRPAEPKAESQAPPAGNQI